MPVTCAEMKRIEEAAFARGVQAEDLMEQAGLGVAEIVRQFHPVPGTCVVFCGKGHNGGDALVAARHLRAWGWRIELKFASSELAPLTARKRDALPLAACVGGQSRPLVLLDGLLGIGAKGEPRVEVAASVEEINRLRREEGGWVLAIDIPSGLDGDTGRPATCCVEADVTVTIACVKEGLVADEAANAVGRLAVVPLAELQPEESEPLATAKTLRAWLPPRRFDMHKGDCGRVGIVAGSVGFLGAARMCSAAAVHGGAGLITVYARPEVANSLAALCIPEVMVKTVGSYREIWRDNLDVIAIGPGLGQHHASEVLTLLREAPQPMVVDADALNILATDIALLKHCAGLRLLTPHPGEMERLFPRRRRSRRDWLGDFLKTYPVSLLLKGARTIIGEKHARFYNSTGNPGMASGGMGDVLTGVCAALAAQLDGEERLFRAGVLGAWLCGRAAEIAVYQPGGSPESLSATGVIDHLGGAFSDLRDGVY